MKILYKIILTLLMMSWGNFLHAGDEPGYKVSLIPKELINNAKAIIRQNEIIIDIDKDDAEEAHKLVITIMNKNGYDLSIFSEVYDKFTKISGICIRIFDKEGKKFKSYGIGDVIDHSAISGYSLFEDNRVKYFDPQYRQYPFTIEITYKRKLKSLMFLPYWEIYPDYNCSIEKSSLTLNLSDDTKLRYFEKNMPQKCSIEEKDKKKIIKWSVNNLSAFSKEEFEEPFLDYMPVVFLSPEEFEVDGIKGNLDSWKDFGKWVINLNKGRDTLSPATVKQLLEITNGLTPRKKVQKIYEFMQKRTRYVSIQVGIGGWQPFDAMTVDRLAYGDCKALANYTYSLLKAVGVRSNYTLITAGENAHHVFPDFPSQFFNHAILTVPLENDTIFLECTNPYLPYAHIGSFTDDRYALLITENEGRLIKTRKYKPDENLVSSKSIINLDNEGSGKAMIKTSYHGSDFDDVKYLSVQSNEDIKKALYAKMNISNFEITDFSFNQPDKNIPLINENINITLDRYATIINKKILITLNLTNKIVEIPNITDKRKSHIYIRRPDSSLDSAEYIIPQGYKIEKVPNDCEIKTDFASYSTKCILTEGKLIYIRKLNIIPGCFTPTDAQKFNEFYTKVSQADMTKVAFVKK